MVTKKKRPSLPKAAHWEDLYVRELEATGHFRVLRAFEAPPARYAAENDLQKFTGAILDVETTGLNHETDKIIQLAIVTFEYDGLGNVHRVLTAESWFNDPDRPIPEEITELTGITDDMVKGQHFPLEMIDTRVRQSEIIIAHNAAFDRKFCEELFGRIMKSASWACSMKEIDWKVRGAPGASLQALAWHHGFYFEGHEALIDCQALLHILAQGDSDHYDREVDEAPRSLLCTLLESASTTRSRLWAINSPFFSNDTLKARGYSWSPEFKTWWKDMEPGDIDAEQRFLSANVLVGRSGRITPITARERYSARLNPQM